MNRLSPVIVACAGQDKKNSSSISSNKAVEWRKQRPKSQILIKKGGDVSSLLK